MLVQSDKILEVQDHHKAQSKFNNTLHHNQARCISLAAQSANSDKPEHGLGAAHAAEMHQTCRLGLCRYSPHRLSWARLSVAVSGLLVLMMTWLWGLRTQENSVLLHGRRGVGNTVHGSRACEQNIPQQTKLSETAPGGKWQSTVMVDKSERQATHAAVRPWKVKFELQ